MNTKIQKMDRRALCRADFEEAADILKSGGLVAFPTETVYGLGGNALDAGAAARIYAAKGRPSDNPLIVHIANREDIARLAVEVPEEAWRLAEIFWPGPLTMILKKNEMVPDGTTGGLSTVAIRMPSDEIAAGLIRESGLFLAAPSANASGRPSTTRAEHVYEDLRGRIPLILDGGPVSLGLESTIVDLTEGCPMILRPGCISMEQLRAVLPELVFDKAVLRQTPDENIRARAPGMKYRHYAPRGSLVIYEGEEEDVIRAINQEVEKQQALGRHVAVLATEETKQRYICENIKSVGSRCDEAAIAANLFDILRKFDEDKTEQIYSESFETAQLGQAIMNRLLKAAGYHVVRV